MKQNYHQMKLERTHSDGGDEWYCPVCGRRFILYWQNSKRVVLEEGDITATHRGSLAPCPESDSQRDMEALDWWRQHLGDKGYLLDS